MLKILSKKEEFLSKLKTKNGYKRYLGSPLRYPGGKSLAVGKIIEMMPDDVTKIISPFIGGGSVEIAIAKELGIPVQGFDTFDLLVNYWNCQIDEPGELYNLLKTYPNSKECYEDIKRELQERWSKETGIKEEWEYELDLAAMYFFNFNLSFGPAFLGWMSKNYRDKRKYEAMLQKVKNFNVPNLCVAHRSFEDVLRQENVRNCFSTEFLFLDPPYYLDGDSKMFKGIYPSGNFPIHHTCFRHDVLADLLYLHNGKFLLCYNDCNWVREAYNHPKFKITEVSWQYTMSQGETRISKTRIREGRNNVKQSHEIIITNY